MAVLQFKFDESYDHQMMVVGGWIADELEWKRLEGAWKRRIDEENERSEPDQQITRFHAAEMNCKDGEFANWGHGRCIRLSRKLIQTLARRRMGAVAIGCDMEAIQAIWPEGDKSTLQRRTYVLSIKQMMIELANIMVRVFPGDTVLLIHDHGNWDDEVLQAYKLMVDEPEWRNHHVFEGIVSKTGSDPTAIGLQAADMIAYEVFKGLKAAATVGSFQMRVVMQELINQGAPINAKWIDMPAAKLLYQLMQDSGKYPDLDKKGIT